MNRQQILHEQATLKQQYEKKEIAPREYVSEMTRLKSELSIVEKQICDDYDRIVLENNILKEKSLSAIELNEAMLPKSYLRISERFPHLNMKEIIEFDKKVRDNGGSIKVHGGVFRVTCRSNTNNDYKHQCPNNIYLSWDCCHSCIYVYNGSPIKVKPKNKVQVYYPCGTPYDTEELLICMSISRFKCGAPNCVCDVDLQNRNPIGLCDNPVTFYLNPEDDLQNIKEIKVSDVSTAISSNITLFESAIQEYSIKINKWKELQKTLDCLI